MPMLKKLQEEALSSSIVLLLVLKLMLMIVEGVIKQVNEELTVEKLLR